MTVGAVTGLAAEAEVAAELGLAVAVGAGTPAGTDAAIAELLRKPVVGLLSFGIAGGLAPGLTPGTLILPAAVRCSDGSAHWVDVAWHARLTRVAHAAGLSLVVGGMLGTDRIAATVAEKAALNASTHAVAVDIESHRVAAAAARAQIPFVILRAIADPAERNLPPAALVPLTDEGQPSVRVLMSILSRPYQVPALIRLAQETRIALRALRRGGAALGEALLHP